MEQTKPKKRVEYVNNKDFLAAMVTYRKDVLAAKETESDRPRVPNYIGECIMKIATHLSQKPNFVNYTFRDEMISDGIENCLQYIDNFNPERSQNPFAYFTQIIYFAFLRRIAKEKKSLYVKYKLTEEMATLNLMTGYQEHDTSSHYSSDEGRFGEWNNEYIDEFIQNFEETKRRKVKKKAEAQEAEHDEVIEDTLTNEDSADN